MVQQSTTTVRPEDAPLTTVDRVRWGAVIAGLFAAVSVLIVLAVAGIAIGFSTFKAGDNASGLLLGTGIWGGLSVLVAFFVGGGTAARTAAVHGRGNGALNGLMVYLVALPLLLYTLIGGVGSLLNTVTSAAATGAQVAAQAVAPVVQQGAQAAATTVAGPAGTQLVATAQAAAAAIAPSVQAAVPTIQAAVNNVPAAQVQQAANTVTQTALTTLLSLGLGVLAAVLGGMLGARSTDALVSTTTRTIR